MKRWPKPKKREPGLGSELSMPQSTEAWFDASVWHNGYKVSSAHRPSALGRWIHFDILFAGISSAVRSFSCAQGVTAASVIVEKAAVKKPADSLFVPPVADISAQRKGGVAMPIGKGRSVKK